MIAQPLDSGNHLFTGLAQILPPPHLPPHGNTGPSNPWWLPCTLRIKPSLSRGHTKTTVTSALTPSSLSLLAAPVTPFGPYQFLHALVLRRPRAVRRSLGAPGTTLCVCYSLALDSVSGSARILYRASIYWVLSSRHFIWVNSYKYFICIIPFQFTTILRGWYIEVLILQMRELGGEPRQCAARACTVSHYATSANHTWERVTWQAVFNF